LSEPSDFPTVFSAALTLGRSLGWKTLELRGGASLLESQAGYRPSTSFYVHRLKLATDTAALFARFDSAHRRAIRKAQSCGLHLEVSTEAAAMRDFYGLMCRTRKRHGVPPQPWQFFENIQREFIAPGHGCVVLARADPRSLTAASEPAAGTDSANSSPKVAPGTGRPDTQPAPASAGASAAHFPAVAGAVYLHSPTVAHYKFGASDESFQQLRANNLVMWHAIQWHGARGFASLDFGRTSLDNEGLRRFKLGWGTDETRLDYVKIALANGEFLSAPDRASGSHTRLFRALPIPVAKLVGRLLYRHIG
jgi:hypothetical protein